MKTRAALFQLLLLTLAISASGQTLPVAPEAPLVRPLNLTLPATLTSGPESVATRRPPMVVDGRKLDDAPCVGRLRYGAGYESRQQGATSSGNGGNGAGGRGAGGQGGKGRGR